MDPLSFWLVVTLVAAAASTGSSVLGEAQRLCERNGRNFLDHWPYYSEPTNEQISLFFGEEDVLRAVANYYGTLAWMELRKEVRRTTPDLSTGLKIPGAATAREKASRLVQFRKDSASFLEKAQAGFVSKEELDACKAMFSQLEGWMVAQISDLDWRVWFSMVSRDLQANPEDWDWSSPGRKEDTYFRPRIEASQERQRAYKEFKDIFPVIPVSLKNEFTRWMAGDKALGRAISEQKLLAELAQRDLDAMEFDKELAEKGFRRSSGPAGEIVYVKKE